MFKVCDVDDLGAFFFFSLFLWPFLLMSDDSSPDGDRNKTLTLMSSAAYYPALRLSEICRSLLDERDIFKVD